MIPKVEIKLADENSLYFPGDKLAGNVLVFVPPDTLVRGLRLKCVGIGVVTWAAGFGDQATTHYEKEKYVNLTEVLAEGDIQDDVDEHSVISEGSHSFLFQIRLPTNIPQSLEEPGCFIRYRLKACLRRAGTSDIINKLTFKVGVAAKLDLNTIPEARTSSLVTSSKRESRWCRRDGFVSASLRLERTGYVPGERIVCSAEVEDNSNTKKVFTKFKLYKKITKKVSTGNSDAMQTKLVEVSKTPIRSGQSDFWCQESITVPSTPPSTLPGCKVVELGYFVCLVVKPWDIRIPIDIVIGTEPFSTIESSNNEIVTEADVHATISDLGRLELNDDNVT